MAAIAIDVRNRGGGALGTRTPPRFCNKQRSALFPFRKCPFFSKGKSALEASCPQFEMLHTSLDGNHVCSTDTFKQMLNL